VIVDTHCHLDMEDDLYINDLADLLKDNNVCHVIVCAYDINSSIRSLEISNKKSIFSSVVGVSPQEVSDLSPDYLSNLEKMININISKVVAIGEIGLDYYYTKSNHDLQKIVFENQLKLAEKYSLPVTIHTRDAFFDTYEILKKYKVKGVIHCYSGSYEMAKRFIKLGFKLGIGGVITFKNSKTIVEVVENISLKDIVLETDSPYLSPEPVRGKLNTSLNLIHIIRKIAEELNISEEEMIDITTNNARRLYERINK